MNLNSVVEANELGYSYRSSLFMVFVDTWMNYNIRVKWMSYIFEYKRMNNGIHV